MEGLWLRDPLVSTDTPAEESVNMAASFSGAPDPAGVKGRRLYAALGPNFSLPIDHDAMTMTGMFCMMSFTGAKFSA